MAAFALVSEGPTGAPGAWLRSWAGRGQPAAGPQTPEAAGHSGVARVAGCRGNPWPSEHPLASGQGLCVCNRLLTPPRAARRGWRTEVRMNKLGGHFQSGGLMGPSWRPRRSSPRGGPALSVGSPGLAQHGGLKQHQCHLLLPFGHSGTSPAAHFPRGPEPVLPEGLRALPQGCPLSPRSPLPQPRTCLHPRPSARGRHGSAGGTLGAAAQASWQT